ncbi:hypothetical protein ACU18_00750 [Arthrobacter sp. ZBG10]|nr:hypothetical protein ACU18_00750 [Arthrobacter sp. ZBG10]
MALCCWLGACAPAPGVVPAPTNPDVPAGPPAPGPQAPPWPQAPTTSTAAAVPSAASATPGAPPAAPPVSPAPAPGTGGSSPPPAATPGAAATPSSAPPSAPVAAPVPGPIPASGTSAPSGLRTVTTYYVLLDDGGRNGVRFGCNDSLVGLSRQLPAATAAAPLRAALGPLLGPAESTDVGAALPAGTYNALAGATLTLLSGRFDGTTVTVYLAGGLNPGGVCDLPRLEMQLTQTAVAAVGAVRAEIYINGVPLGQALRLDQGDGTAGTPPPGES